MVSLVNTVTETAREAASLGEEQSTTTESPEPDQPARPWASEGVDLGISTDFEVTSEAEDDFASTFDPSLLSPDPEPSDTFAPTGSAAPSDDEMTKEEAMATALEAVNSAEDHAKGVVSDATETATEWTEDVEFQANSNPDNEQAGSADNSGSGLLLYAAPVAALVGAVVIVRR